MYSLRIEHTVANYEGWKKLFDSDPIGRKKMGVRHYRILRPIDDPKHVIIVLDFDKVEQAKATEAALRQLWSKIDTAVMSNAQMRILEHVESTEL